MKKALLFSAMAAVAMTASAAGAADYMKVTFHDKEVENGGMVVVDNLQTEGVLGGVFGYTNHDDFIIVENVSDAAYDLSWKTEFKNPDWATFKADPKKYGQYSICTAPIGSGVGNCFNADPTTGVVDKVYTGMKSNEGLELQEHLVWASGGMVNGDWQDFTYTDADIEAARNTAIELTVTLCPQNGDKKVDGAEFVFTLHFGVEDAAVGGIEAEVNAPVEYYNLQGVKVANPEKGLYIQRQGNNVKKVIL